eukprot:1651010-Amphidinium_carterae.1
MFCLDNSVSVPLPRRTVRGVSGWAEDAIASKPINDWSPGAERAAQAVSLRMENICCLVQ